MASSPNDGDDVDSHYSSDENDWSSSTDSSSPYSQEISRELASATSPSQPRFATAEDRCLNNFRRTILVVVLVTAAIVATVVNHFLRNEENTSFQANYFLTTNTIRDAIQAQVNSLVDSYGGLGDILTATGSPSLPPIPVFSVSATHARHVSNTRSCLFTPLVTVSQKTQWENYSVTHWTNNNPELLDFNVTPFIYQIDGNETVPSLGPAPYWPVWTISPPLTSETFVNFDMASITGFRDMLEAIQLQKAPIFSDFLDAVTGSLDATPMRIQKEEPKEVLQQFVEWEYSSVSEHPHTVLIQPVFDSLGSAVSGIAGALQVLIAWDYFFTQLLPASPDVIYGVLKNTCGDNKAFTYSFGDDKVFYVGAGDLHEQKYDSMKVSVPFQQANASSTSPGYCQYWMDLYPSETFEAHFHSDVPAAATFAAILVFVVTGLVFLTFNRSAELRNNKVLSAALKGHQIVASLFPSTVRNRLFEDDTNEKQEPVGVSPYTKQAINRNLEQYLDEADVVQKDEDVQSPPIADLFPECTVFFADIAGFTAWSSSREPARVFTLLETVYNSFDKIARKRRVFKVETVGDCYVAVTGLPERRKDHAVAMARFARDCMKKMNKLTKDLVVTLGPDTCDLSMRMGMHSGPVTAGVLRGDRARFQLFGDTVNTASRMESTGERDHIQVSRETADLLASASKGHWLSPREEQVHAKGKGAMSTYWLFVDLGSLATASSTGTISTSGSDLDDSSHHIRREASHCPEQSADSNMAKKLGKTGRLIDWNVEVLLQLLKQVVARRGVLSSGASNPERTEMPSDEICRSPLDEVQEIIALPEVDCMEAATSTYEDPEKSIVLSSKVVEQLHAFVTSIAMMHRDNPFHNFEHASHVTNSVVKLLTRIMTPCGLDYYENAPIEEGEPLSVHDNSYGITSNPLTQFACVFSALIHDVDHCGVPNAQLVKEECALATLYKGKSVNEQNSITLAWELLMEDIYSDLRAAIFSNDEERKQFRQLVVNSVMATDIVDAQLKELRSARWEKAFNESSSSANPREANNRKATIVIEHLIQASDVAHTMQHWLVYLKWNERLLFEMVDAYNEKRAEKDPIDLWYQGELDFFDFYIIPLAKKLKECGVFGVASDEYLNYAVTNRQAWELQGRDIVAGLAEKVEKRGLKEKEENTTRQNSSKCMHEIVNAFAEKEADSV